MNAAKMIVFATLMIGCTTVEKTFAESVPADNISVVRVDIDNGHFSYQGMATNNIDVTGRSYGYASNAERAEERQDGTTWGMTVTGAELNLSGRSDASMAGVDFSVAGPGRLNTSVYVQDGSATIDTLYGNILVDAESINARKISGNIDLVSRFGDIDAEILPNRGEMIRVEAQNGDVELWLPWGLDYDLQVWGDPEYEMVIDDLGFGWTTAAPGYFAAQTGPASTRVDVYATGGSVRIYMIW